MATPSTTYNYSRATGYARPRQKVSTAQKTKKWADESAEFYSGACVDAVDIPKAIQNYRLANGELDEKEYLYVTNPLNTKRPELQGYPAKLDNYDIISVNIGLLMGEKARRQFPPIVYTKNSLHQSKRMETEKQLLVRELQKRFINEVRAMGMPLEEEQITMQLEEIAASVRNLPDILAAQNQDTLEYIIDNNKVFRKFREGYLHWLCNACVYSYKDVYADDTCYEMVSPIHIGYLCSETRPFIRDGEAVRCWYKMSANEIYDRFQDEKDFTGEVADFVDDYSHHTSTDIRHGHSQGRTDRMTGVEELFTKIFGNRAREEYASGIDVEHVMWRSQTKEGTLIRQDPFGNVQTFIVDDTYIPLPDDDITWRWKDQIWENYCIGDRYWLGAKPIPICNGEKPFLLYNGRNALAYHTRPRSIVDKGRSYQKSVNIIKYRAESTLAKNLDKLILFPLGLIPNKEGWDIDKWMYYVRSTSFLFFDETKNNAHLLLNALKDLDMSMLQHVVQSYQLIGIVKQEWDEACGFNPQRKGDIKASAGATVTRDAQERSYIISEEMFLEYDEFEQSEYEDLLEIGKFAFAGGKTAWFTRQDGTVAFLDLHDPSSFVWSQLGVFVKNSAKELAKLGMLKDQVMAFAQNQVDPKMVTAIVESDNFAKLHGIMDEIDAKMEMRRQQEMEAQKNQTDAQERIAQGVERFKYYDADLKAQTDIQVALINAGIQITQQMKKMEEGGQTKSPEYEGLRNDLEGNLIDLMKNATKMKEIDAKVKMNKLDNETALKNKVAGEK